MGLHQKAVQVRYQGGSEVAVIFGLILWTIVILIILKIGIDKL